MADSSLQQFVSGVSSQTGLDPRVLYAWAQAEGAYAAGGTGGYNYLNLRPYPGDPYSGVSRGNFEQFSNVNDAVTATVRRLKQPFAAPILAAARAKTPPRGQIAAIAATGWDAGHYGGAGGPNLLRTFATLYPNAADQYLPNVGTATQGGFGSTTGGSVGGVGGAVASGAGAVGGALSSTADFLGKITDPNNLLRAAEVLAGAVLILTGVYLLAKQVGLAAPSVPGPVGAAAAAVS